MQTVGYAVETAGSSPSHDLSCFFGFQVSALAVAAGVLCDALSIRFDCTAAAMLISEHSPINLAP